MYVYGVDGECINQSTMDYFKLSPNDMRYDKNINRYRFDFVGFVFSKEKILTVFPKKYYENNEIDHFNNNGAELKDDIKLLYDSIQKYSKNPRTKAKADSYLGAKNGYESDYPFNAFYKIYDYYRQYGLYKVQEEIIKAGTYGKVSWKKTIQKSQVIISDDNLIFLPLYIRKNNMKTGFITDCMAFVIDYTISQFEDFITLPRINYGKNNFDYLNNINYVVRKLQELKVNIHKDIDRELVDNLISFFLQYKAKCNGGSIHIKINYFEWVWQSAVGLYLNSYYDRFDKLHNSIIFDTSRTSSAVSFETKTIQVDDSKNGYEIDMDHFGIDGSNMYIFDSKYYYELNEVNYKQYAYNELLRYYDRTVTDIISVLILPGQAKSDVHFSLASTLKGPRVTGNKIYEQYIEVKDVLKNYIR